MNIVDTFFEELKRIKNELEAHEDITITEFFINDPQPAVKIDAEERIPTLVREILKVADGFKLSWESSDPLVKGDITFPMLENIHLGRWKSFGNLDYSDFIHVVFQKRDEINAGVFYEGFEGEDEEELLPLEGGVHTIEDYLRAVIKTYGHRFWQENYSPEREYSIDALIENRAYAYTVVEG